LVAYLLLGAGAQLKLSSKEAKALAALSLTTLPVIAERVRETLDE
jgi:hypothetical protein